jgi:hypothetical protein
MAKAVRVIRFGLYKHIRKNIKYLRKPVGKALHNPIAERVQAVIVVKRFVVSHILVFLDILFFLFVYERSV